MKKSNILVIALSTLSLLSLGLSLPADPQKEMRKKIDAGSAKTIKTEINFIVGTLTLKPGSGSLTEGIFRFSRSVWEPEIKYEEQSEEGRLIISSRDTRGDMSYDDSDKNAWDIAMNSDIPNDIRIRMTAGESNIDLEGCKLTRFDFKMAAGKSVINLRNTSVPEFYFSAAAGEAEIDLSGEWYNNLHAVIKGGVGELTVILPRNKGIDMNITGMIGDVEYHDLEKRGNYYRNSLLGKAAETLRIDITGGIGGVKIRLAD